MPVYRVNVIFDAESNIPEDSVVNTFHFVQSGPLVDANNVRDMLKDFYETQAPGASARVAQYMSNQFKTTARVQMYNLDQPKPRPPVYESTFTHAPGSTQVLPREVALVLSFQASREAGELQSRRRNRIYLGPLNTAGLVGGTSLPAPQLITALTCAGAEMLRASNAAFTWDWRVYSPTDNNYHPIDNGWVDNAWDTQRRRGRSPTARTTWNAGTGV